MVSFFSTYHQWSFAFLINTILILSFHRLPLLTRAGWIHSGILGTILWGCLGVNGWLAVVAYLILGSLVTKVGFLYKTRKGLAESRGGKRGPENVWGAAFIGALLAILIGLGVGDESIVRIGFAASFSSKLADTFGSEIGKRWGKRAYLITNFQTVSPGTEGAISVNGTLASFLGSIVMTSVMAFLEIIPFEKAFFIVFIAGVIATLIESILGATLQSRFTWLTNELINGIQTFIAAFIAIILAIIYL
ncbi:TIGR00297 family protein [Prochlorococcus sp. MIT 1341]|uniref:TIGR00297 family protein n=1 Tax=Prochlorococcus sp. MIT 1341 TaxID=3096221 RepID=UPI002A74848B|nr:TIGR00297 family protein [Prochlorococcus sp. MIT 1341]